jgi:hypothetical protein
MEKLAESYWHNLFDCMLDVADVVLICPREARWLREQAIELNN